MSTKVGFLLYEIAFFHVEDINFIEECIYYKSPNFYQKILTGKYIIRYFFKRYSDRKVTNDR